MIRTITSLNEDVVNVYASQMHACNLASPPQTGQTEAATRMVVYISGRLTTLIHMRALVSGGMGHNTAFPPCADHTVLSKLVFLCLYHPIRYRHGGGIQPIILG